MTRESGGFTPETRARIAELTDVLEDCRDYFEQRADADLDESGYTANEEMRLLVDVKRVLARLGK